jgi:alcohol dehydrogenase class IV
LGIDTVGDIDTVADALTAYYRSIGAPITCTEAGIADPDIDHLTNLAFAAFQQRGMDDYTKDIIAAVYRQSI